MVSSSKVLTVSYGTFSCTLEGFDDSFETMKAIAEYFRDLAADDRYFGAEPPTPDADMLARIAEKEVARRVEAHFDDGNIVLRTEMPDQSSVTASPAELVAPAQAKDVAAAPAHIDTALDGTADDAAQAVSETASEAATEAGNAASDAARAMDLEASETAQGQTTDFPQAAVDAATDADQTATDDPVQTADISDAQENLAPEIETDTDIPPVDDTASPASEQPSETAQTPETQDTETQDAGLSGLAAGAAAAGFAAAGTLLGRSANEDESVAEDVTTSAQSNEDRSLSAKLARIRAVVGQPESSTDADAQGAQDQSTYSEDEHADEILDTLPGDTDLADILPETDTNDAGDAQADDAEAEANAPEDGNDPIANVMARLASDAAQSPAHEEQDVADLPDVAQQTDKSDAPTQDSALAAEDAASGQTPDVDAASEQPQRPVRARVIKVKRAEFEEALKSGQLEAVDAAESETGKASQSAAYGSDDDWGDAASDVSAPVHASSDETPAPSSSLSDEEEAELQRELAAVEAELAGLDAPVQEPVSEGAEEPDLVDQSAQLPPPVVSDAARDDTYLEDEHAADDDYAALASDTAAQHEASAPPAARSGDELAHPPEVEMDRLMTQATDELEEPEGKQRRNALGHLRAAVAAARAGQRDGSIKDEDATEPYREDLDTAMRPKRPVRRIGGPRAERAAPPPLKLVAEQRVDMPAPTETQTQASPGRPAAPARPTRPARPRRSAQQVIGAPAAPAQPDPQPEAAPAATAAPVKPARPARTQPASEPATAPVSDVAPEGGTFMEFAEEMNATELPDLLEAAAAYIAYVEGRDQFSRPQLMTKVRMVQEDNFSREDGLRSFGQLLRQGKIEKISGGRFTVSDRISFKPDTREAG